MKIVIASLANCLKIIMRRSCVYGAEVKMDMGWINTYTHVINHLCTIIIPILCVFYSLVPRPLPNLISQPSGEGLGSLLRHELEMVDTVSTNRVHITY